MAGVGFELKKVFRENGGLLNSLRGFSLTAVITEGPMILTMVMLWGNRMLLKMNHGTFRQEEIYLFSITYVMIFSLILSNSVLMFVDRFISDCIYQKKIDSILPSFFGIILVLNLIGVPVSLLYLSTIPMSVVWKAAVLTCFSTMLIIWVQMAYLSAIHQYSYELLGFFAGSIVSLGGSLILVRLGVDGLLSVTCGTACGFLVMLCMFMAELIAFFPLENFDILCFLPSLDHYRILIVIGILMALGLYGHNFVFWLSEYADHVFQTGVFCTRYDVPTFFATLTIIPLLVRFVVSLETSFSVKNKAYFDTILAGGRFDDIMAAKKDLVNTLYRELARTMESQLVFTLLAVIFLGNVLSSSGLDEAMLGIFRTLCFGYCIYGMVKSMTIILLYFDDRKGACVAAALFTGTTIAFSLVTLFLPVSTWGVGFLTGNAIAFVWLMIRIRYMMEHLEYKVFCQQPLFVDDHIGIFEKLKKRIDRKEEAYRSRRKNHEKR